MLAGKQLRAPAAGQGGARAGVASVMANVSPIHFRAPAAKGVKNFDIPAGL